MMMVHTRWSSAKNYLMLIVPKAPNNHSQFFSSTVLCVQPTNSGEWCKLVTFPTSHLQLVLCLPLVKHWHARSSYSVWETAAAVVPTSSSSQWRPTLHGRRSCGRCSPAVAAACIPPIIAICRRIVQTLDACHRWPQIGGQVVQRCRCVGRWVTLESVFPMGSRVVQQDRRSDRISLADRLFGTHSQSAAATTAAIQWAGRGVPSLAQAPYRSSTPATSMYVTIRIHCLLPQLDFCGRCPAAEELVDPLVLHLCRWWRVACHV